MSNPAIRVENLSKQYRLGETHARSLRDLINGAVAGFFGREASQACVAASTSGDRSRRVDENGLFQALQDVSFEVQPGEVVGVIGRNGAGKSTLLKILSGIVAPSFGRAEIYGRVASLLEVGTGFHPELTGRENVFLNGAILGMTKGEVRKAFDKIVAFAEIEQFIDTPVKRYSSGMYVRLAFAIAAHLEPEILIVDEVLAVGDAQFQQKCLGKMHDVAHEGRTVIFVSHNHPAVRTLCTRALLLSGGRNAFFGSVDEGLDLYTARTCERITRWSRPPADDTPNLFFSSINIEVFGKQPDLTLQVDLILSESKSYSAAFVALDILDSSGVAIMQILPRAKPFLTANGNGHRLKITCILPPLIPGQYSITAWVGPSYTETYDMIETPVSFSIDESPNVQRTVPHTKNHGWIAPQSVLEHIKT